MKYNAESHIPVLFDLETTCLGNLRFFYNTDLIFVLLTFKVFTSSLKKNVSFTLKGLARVYAVFLFLIVLS